MTGLLARLNMSRLLAKIALTVIAASVTGVVIVAVVSFQREQGSFERALEQEAETLLAVLTETADNALFLLDVDTIELLADGTVTSDGVEAVRFYDRDGRLIADSDNPEILTFSDSIDPAGLALLGAEDVVFEWRNSRLVAAQRVQLGSQTHGAIAVELSTEILQQNISTARTQAIALTAIAATIAVILAFMLSRSIVGPLLRLIEAARKVSQGDYAQAVEIKTRDELEALADAFNTMTQSIQQSTGGAANSP